MLLTPVGFFYGSRLSVLTLVDSTFITGSASSTAPNDIQEGDLILFVDMQQVGSASDGHNTRSPTGFQSVFNHNQAFRGTNDTFTTRFRISQKIANGTEGGSTLLGMDNAAKYCMVFRGNHAITSSTPDGFKGTGSSSSGTSTINTSYTTNDLPCLVLSLAASHLSGPSTSVTPTPTVLLANGSSQKVGVSVKLAGSSPGTVSVSAKCTGSTLTGRHAVGGRLLLGID
jgi:hypothetical protein